MRNIKHIFDSELDSKLVSSLPYNGNDMVYNEWDDKLYRFVKPTDTNQTFGSWKVHMPTYTFKKHGNILNSVLMGSLNDSYNLFDQTDIFGTDLSSKFMLQTNVHWQKKIGGSGNDIGYAIDVDSSGNVYLSGHQESDSYDGTYDYGVIKLDSSGNILWQKKIGGGSNDYGIAVAVDSVGNVYLNGHQESDVHGGTYDYGVIKLDSSGNILWQKKVGGIGSDVGYAIAVDSVGNVYLTGYQGSDVHGGTYDYGVIKLNTNGNILWQKKIGGIGNDYGRAIAVDSSGNVYLSGHQGSDSYGVVDYGVIKLDSSGNILWQKKIGGGSNDYGFAIAVDSVGNVYLNGYQESDVHGGTYDYGVIKLDSSGNILWQKKIGGSGNDIGYDIAVDDSGNIYLNGYQESDIYGGTYDYGVIKLDSSGNILWQKKIGGSGNDNGYAIAVDSFGNIYLNGRQESDSYGVVDYGVIKLDTDQESDMSLSIGDMSLSIGAMSLTIGDMNLSIGDMNLSIGDMSLSIGDVDISGTVVDGLNYIG